MSKLRITLVLLLAATASYVVTKFDAESGLEAVVAMASVAELVSLAIIAVASIMLVATLAVASWDRLKMRARPKSALRVGGTEDATQAPGRR